MRKMADSISFLSVPFLLAMFLAVLSLNGCYYPGYYDDPYDYPYDSSISFNPPAIDFFYSDRHSAFSYSGYPFYFPFYPYPYYRYYDYPYNRFYH